MIGSDKRIPSARCHKGVSVPQHARLGGHKQLIVAGLQTNVCVEATVRAGLEHNFEVAVAEDAVSTDGPALHYAALNSMRVLYVAVAPWRDLIGPAAAWDTAYTTPNYCRDTAYWTDPITAPTSTMPATEHI
ncbi:cysteine hydrolase family protein [Nocardia sp. NPDC052278]|uniref:cysteine hydrolase family protein n=1 Tax=unclassified Nocardia TaxID=2637762 RepID=UPI0036939DB3